MTCLHPILDCGAGGPAGTPAVCRHCRASVVIPPARVYADTWTTPNRKTIPGMGLSAKRRLEIELDMGHAGALVDEGFTGARE